MSLNDLEDKSVDIYHFGDELIELITDDGSTSLKSKFFNEAFHASSGAIKETIEKFIKPSQIYSYNPSKEILILDICFGMGYNSASLMNEAIKHERKLNWWGIEINKTPLKIALGNENFKSNWNAEILNNLYCLHKYNSWSSLIGKGTMLWGDARAQIKLIPKTQFFDLIYLDAFSPQHCPQLWSEEFLFELAAKLSKNGRVITYSSAAAIRGSFKRAGLKIRSLLPTENKDKFWSNGTVAIKTNNVGLTQKENLIMNSLSQMEEEHLRTVAAVPYRDPTMKSSTSEILKRREKEQKKSKLNSTSSWKKHWSKTKINIKY